MANVTVTKKSSASAQKQAAADFAAYWKGKGYEKGQSQPFWTALLSDVLGVEHPEQFITFEDQVKMDHTSFIDGYIPSTRVLIEQKSLPVQSAKNYLNVNLRLESSSARYTVQLSTSITNCAIVYGW